MHAYRKVDVSLQGWGWQVGDSAVVQQRWSQRGSRD